MRQELPTEILDVLKEFTAIADEAASTCDLHVGAELTLVDRCLYGWIAILMPALDRWHRQQRTVIWHECAPKRASPSFIFVGLLANLINSGLSARRLAVCGFDRQARMAFRELTEIGDLLLAILAEEAFIDDYLASPEDFQDAKEHWRDRLRPWKIRSRVQKVLGDAWPGHRLMGEKTFWSAQWNLYDWLSKSAHIDYAALVVNSVASDFGGRYDINLGGRVGPHTQSTLASLGAHVRDLLSVTAFILNARHGWSADYPELFQAIQEVNGLAVG
jgi:hypothetical protein